MEYSVATVTLRGLSPYSQSRQHDEPWLDGESHDAYDARTWRSKMTLTPDKTSVVIPAHGVHQSLAAGAKYSKRKIVGQGNATWTGKFTSGIMVPENPVLNIDPATVSHEAISVNADGIRGSRTRVIRRFPVMYEWSPTFDVWILDPQITEVIFREMLEMSGLFIGLGRFRPEKGGSNGRYELQKLAWQDNRQLAA